jgi:parallel beta-helix repeat protein
MTKISPFIALLALLAGAPSAAAETYHVSTTGSDSDPGTEEQPWGSIEGAARRAAPGDTVYIHPGSYGDWGTVTTVAESGTAESPIDFVGLPDQPRPTVRGHFKITGNDLRFSRITFDGPTGPVKPVAADNPKGEQVQVAVNGDSVEIMNSVVRDSDWHAGIYLAGADQARLVGNCIQDNGDRDPAVRQYQRNKSHGIYWDSGSGLIANNVVVGNLARGIQLYKAPNNVRVLHNTVVTNGRAGIQFSAQTSRSSAVNNIVAYNGDAGIRTYGLIGSGNVAANNLGWANGAENFISAERLDVGDNLGGWPGFVDARARDFRLLPGSAALDQGDEAESVSTDHIGTVRPQAVAPDIGAFERTEDPSASEPDC